MNVHAEKQASFLFRLRSQDTPTGVSNETLDALMQKPAWAKQKLPIWLFVIWLMSIYHIMSEMTLR